MFPTLTEESISISSFITTLDKELSLIYSSIASVVFILFGNTAPETKLENIRESPTSC